MKVSVSPSLSKISSLSYDKLLVAPNVFSCVISQRVERFGETTRLPLTIESMS